MNVRVFEVRQPLWRQPFRQSKDVFNELSHLSKADRESLWVLTLNAGNMVLDCSPVHVGTADTCTVGRPEVFKGAISDGAVSIIMVHNHPSGGVSPSVADDTITRAILAGGQILGIRLLDHVIIGQGVFYSYADAGRLQEWEQANRPYLDHLGVP